MSGRNELRDSRYVFFILVPAAFFVVVGIGSFGLAVARLFL